MIDGKGIYGFVFHYALLFASTLATLLVFLYLLVKRKLGIDEDSKFHVFEKGERDERE